MIYEETIEEFAYDIIFDYLTIRSNFYRQVD